MTDADRFAEAASALQGARFRLHGRDPATGLDCVGLVSASLLAIGRSGMVPRGYALRNCAVEAWLDLIPSWGFEPATGALRRGDLTVTTPGPGQYHLMVAISPAWVVHAHAGLRRVVRQPIENSFHPDGHWRLTGTES